MALATWQDLCIDAVDARAMARFWAGVLHLDIDPDDEDGGKLIGATPAHTVWINQVPDPVTVKQRVHLDVRAASPDDLTARGASVVDADSFSWAVMRDPEGGELCVFGTKPDAGPGLKDIVVDCRDHVRISRWWADVLGAERHEDSTQGSSYVGGIPGAPFEDLCFVPVPEPKTVKNRIHWDVATRDVSALVGAGATVVREPDGDIRWHIVADPEGNEFCAFATEDPDSD